MRSLPMHIARGIGFWFFHLYSKPLSLLVIESFGEVWEGERLGLEEHGMYDCCRDKHVA